MVKALLFGSIGVLAETSDLQRRAFNAAFTEAGLDWSWTMEDYRDLLKSPGGLQRIQEYANARGDDVDAEKIYESKVRHFGTLVTPGTLNPRKGVTSLIAEAKRADIKLGFVTSTGRVQVDLIFQGLLGSVPRGSFDYIGHKGRVENTKPAPDIFLDAIQALDVKSEDALAIEDTPESAKSAVAARIPTMAFPGEAARDREFPPGMTVLSELDVCILKLEMS